MKDIPVNIAMMLSRRTKSFVFLALLIACCCTSVGCNIWTLYQLGMTTLISLGVGVGLTIVVMAVLFVAHLVLGRVHKANFVIEVGVATIAVGLCWWGLVQFAKTRSAMVEHQAAQQQSSTTHSFVDDPDEQSQLAQPATDNAAEAHIARSSGNAMFAMAISAELITGIILALFMRFHEEPDYTAWRELGKVEGVLTGLRQSERELSLRPSIARQLCTAGILRAKAELDRRPPSYHHHVAMAILALILIAVPSKAQTFDHAEGIVIDISGSIGHGANNDLFREYMNSARQLLLSEPPKSRVWVSVVSSESFGSVRPLVKGWTPDRQGVFTDDLNRTRHELASNFEAKAAGLHPISARHGHIRGIVANKSIARFGQCANQRDLDIQ
jgi:hypothetical protein